MNIIEKEAKQFYRSLYNGGRILNLETLKNSIDSKIYNFNRDRDKLDYLKILRQETIADKNDHLSKCSKMPCAYVDARDTGLFAIDQEIESINKYFSTEVLEQDSFTVSEESELHMRLNEIVESIEKLGYGQEVIFEEIESLKNHFNLGKKNWFQLVKGKLIDLTVDQVLDKSIVSKIYESLSKGFGEVTRFIE